MMVTSQPTPARNPAHSKATYEAPTTRVLPGALGKEKRSSLDRASSPPAGRAIYDAEGAERGEEGVSEMRKKERKGGER